MMNMPTIYGDDWEMAYHCNTHIMRNPHDLV